MRTHEHKHVHMRKGRNVFTHGKGQKVTKLVASMFRNVSYNCVLSNQGTGFVAVNECYPACKHTAASWECTLGCMSTVVNIGIALQHQYIREDGVKRR